MPFLRRKLLDKLVAFLTTIFLFVIKIKTYLMIRGHNFHSRCWWIREWVLLSNALKKSNDIIERWHFGDI